MRIGIHAFFGPFTGLVPSSREDSPEAGVVFHILGEFVGDSHYGDAIWDMPGHFLTGGGACCWLVCGHL